jgi:hypothetical protein
VGEDRTKKTFSTFQTLQNFGRKVFDTILFSLHIVDDVPGEISAKKSMNFINC